MDSSFGSFGSNIDVPVTPLLFSSPKLFKKPSALRKGRTQKRFVRPVCDTCDRCGKDYRCHRSYLNHVREHVIRDASSKYPNRQQISDYCLSSFLSVVLKVKSKAAFSSVGEQYQLFLEEVCSSGDKISTSEEWTYILGAIHGAMTEDVHENKVLLPSALGDTLVRNCEQFLSDTSVRERLCGLLQACMKCNVAVGNIFVADYTLQLVTSIIEFYKDCLRRGIQENSTDIPTTELSNEVKETIHYISGSVVRGFYRKSLLFPKNAGWQKVGNVITTRLLESDSVPGPPSIVKGWTTAMNKGKLFFVSSDLYTFFLAVAEILEKITHNKVRIDYEQVLKSVCEDTAVLLWDEAIGESLNETASFELMCGMVKSFCNTYGVGLAKQVLNRIRSNKAEANIPLRHKVAPKK